jgi:hypothetical protein
MAELKSGDEELVLLRKFHEKREGRVPHFYADSVRLVTIGIGYLVDSKKDSDVGKEIARVLAGRVKFRQISGGVASPTEVVAEWSAVKEAAIKASKPPGSRYYQKIAKLRIDGDAINALYDDKIHKEYLGRLYARKPFVKELDGLIQIAFVDALFNPAGVRLYKDDYLKNMWGALDPSKSSFNLEFALERFKNKWKDRGGTLKERYAQRHGQRVAWFKAGAEKMLKMSLP